jgi:cytochrome P450
MHEQQAAPARSVQIPAPAGLPLVGNLLQLPRGRLTQHLMGVAGDFDGIFEIDFAGYRAAFVTSAELAAEVCNEKRFRKIIGPPLSILRAVAGDGLFTAHGDEPNWGKAHRILTPAFGQRARRAYFDAMLEVAGQLVGKWRASQGRPIEVSDDMTRLTLDTIALCGFGYRFDSFAAAQLHPFLRAMARVLEETMGRLTRLRALSRLRWSANRRFGEDIALMHSLVDEVIRTRRAQPGDTRDLLGLMLDAVDPVTGERLDDANIRYQVITFLIAGHETTSGLLTFTLYLLTQHPEVLERAHAEVDAVLAQRRTPAYEDLARLDVIDRVLKEALRLWPTAPMFAVAPFEDTVLGARPARHRAAPGAASRPRSLAEPGDLRHRPLPAGARSGDPRARLQALRQRAALVHRPPVRDHGGQARARAAAAAGHAAGGPRLSSVGARDAHAEAAGVPAAGRAAGLARPRPTASTSPSPAGRSTPCVGLRGRGVGSRPGRLPARFQPPVVIAMPSLAGSAPPSSRPSTMRSACTYGNM